MSLLPPPIRSVVGMQVLLHLLVAECRSGCPRTSLARPLVVLPPPVQVGRLVAAVEAGRFHIYSVSAIEEGIEIIDARGPQACLIDDDGRLVGLKTWRVKSIFDDQGRFAPSYDEGDEQIHRGDMVIEQRSDGVLRYDRSVDGETITVLVNFSESPVTLPGDLGDVDIVLSSTPDRSGADAPLAADEALVLVGP